MAKQEPKNIFWTPTDTTSLLLTIPLGKEKSMQFTGTLRNAPQIAHTQSSLENIKCKCSIVSCKESWINVVLIFRRFPHRNNTKSVVRNIGCAELLSLLWLLILLLLLQLLSLLFVCSRVTKNNTQAVSICKKICQIPKASSMVLELGLSCLGCHYHVNSLSFPNSENENSPWRQEIIITVRIK